MARLRRKFTYSNVISTLCLFLLLGGGAWAAVNLPKHSVGPKQLRKNAVRSWKVKNRSLRRSDLAPGVLPAGLGDGGTGAYSNTNSVDGTISNMPQPILSVNLPAGSYLITLAATIFNQSSQGRSTGMICFFDYGQPDNQAQVYQEHFGPYESHDESIAQAVQLKSPGTVQYDCLSTNDYAPLSAENAHLTAVDVGSIEEQP